MSKKISKVDLSGGSEVSAVPVASPVPSDLSAFIAQLMHVSAGAKHTPLAGWLLLLLVMVVVAA